MKAKLVKENISDVLKPKSEAELGPKYRQIKQETNDFMTNIFSDLHKDPKDPNVYSNSEGRWVFEHDLKNKRIWVSFYRVWRFFENELKLNNNITRMLIESWLKENTDWPQLPTLTEVIV